MEKVVELMIVGILDCLEEFVCSMIMAAGKRMMHVLYVVLLFFISSIVFELLDIPCFISWKEASVATAIVCVINGIDYVNKSSIDNVRQKLQSRIGSIKNNNKE